MKYSAAVLSLAAVVAAQPAFTNLSFDLQEGEPFTLEFTGCDSGCTINLKNGPSDDLQTVEQLTDSATGGSFTFTPENLPTDTYAFEIVDADGLDNYSMQFEYEGVAAPEPTTTEVLTTTEEASSTTEEASSTTEEATSTEESTTMTTPETTMTTMETTTSETASPTDESTTSETASETSAEPTTVPDDDSAAAGLVARGSLVLAAVAGSLLFL